MRRKFHFQSPVITGVTEETLIFALNHPSPKKLRRYTGKCEKGRTDEDDAKWYKNNKEKIAEEAFKAQLEEAGLLVNEHFLNVPEEQQSCEEVVTVVDTWPGEDAEIATALLWTPEFDEELLEEENEVFDMFSELMEGHLQESQCFEKPDEKLDFGPYTKNFDYYIFYGEERIKGEIHDCMRVTRNPNFLP